MPGPDTTPARPRPPRPSLRVGEWALWLVTALAARLVYGWLVQPHLAPSFGWEGDDGYDEIARLWLGGQGYVRWPGGPPTTERLPFYPLFLAGMFRIGGAHGEALAWLAQCVLSTLALVPLGALAVRLGGLRCCRLALALGAVHPVGLQYNFRFMSEPLHLALAVMFTWLAARWAEEGGIGRSSACGAVLGAALLTRSSLVVPGPVALAAAALGRARRSASAGEASAAKGGSRGAAETLLAVAACALVLTPWAWRARGLGEGVVSSGTSAAAYHGLAVSRAAWEGGVLGPVDRASDQELEARLRAALPGLRPEDRSWERARDQLTRGWVLDKLVERPWLSAAETFRNLALAWYLTYTPRGTALAALFQVPILIAAAVAVRRRGRRWPAAWWPALALLVVQTSVQALFYPHFRFMGVATWTALALAADGWAGTRGAGRGRATTDA